ncbi:response regulator transcription factor [Solicola gregarius]|uniref:Response regulator transcription factor n=1 Tax=Solicola gregarius TaxID=2908642 RepID=A0AA46TG96_9ACTN|nr:response regulator transcription factor [Solicola gregarius]UYM04551.1 response regulator transcription factor [Solicola gregarius]
MTVLVVEDDESVRDVVRRYLERDGYEVLLAGDGREGLRAAQQHSPDLVVLDIMLPGLDGLTVCKALRGQPDPYVPIVMLTALGEVDDRITGLELGADDYVTKPFSPKELVLRIRSVLRRTAADTAEDTPLLDGELYVDRAARTATLRGDPLHLTVREFDLLSFLLANAGHAYSRSDLLDKVWGWSFGDHSTVTVHVKRLRHKIERDPTAPERIATVYGVGYRYERAVT